MIPRNKLYIPFGIAALVAIIGFTIFKPEPAVVASMEPVVQEPACVPSGAYVLAIADQMVNEIVQPECKVR